MTTVATETATQLTIDAVAEAIPDVVQVMTIEEEVAMRNRQTEAEKKLFAANIRQCEFSMGWVSVADSDEDVLECRLRVPPVLGEKFVKYFRQRMAEKIWVVMVAEREYDASTWHEIRFAPYTEYVEDICLWMYRNCRERAFAPSLASLGRKINGETKAIAQWLIKQQKERAIG